MVFFQGQETIEISTGHGSGRYEAAEWIIDVFNVPPEQVSADRRIAGYVIYRNNTALNHPGSAFEGPDYPVNDPSDLESLKRKLESFSTFSRDKKGRIVY